MKKPLKIGVMGVGHLGKIHLKCLAMLQEKYQIVGFYEPDASRAAAIAEEFGISAFSAPLALIKEVDVVDIVSPTPTHYELAKLAIENGRHIFVEKPLCTDLDEASALLELAQTAGIKGQVGFVERFNPAFLAIDSTKINPMFIEAHRLAMFNPRGTDVSVVLDLMIHDLDILLTLVKSPVKEVRASGVAIVSTAPDIANARIEFENGTVANITASRISMKNMRKFRLFQADAYVSLDFLEKKTEILRLYEAQEAQDKDNMMELETSSGKKYLEMKMPETAPVNAIKTELEMFADSIQNGTDPTVPLSAGVKALELAYQIMEAVEQDYQKKTNQLQP